MIWYLMRASRRVRRRLIWLVQFLKVFYSQDELKVRAHHHLHNGERGGSDDRIRHAEYAFSLASAVDDPIISSALERSALQTMLGDSKLKKELAALLRFDDPDGKLKALADPLEFMQELKDRVIAARTQWPSGIEADAFASALKGSLTLTPEEKRQVIEALPDWENRQIQQFNRCQPWRAKRRLVDPSSREAALFSRRALRQRENKVGLRTRRPVIGSQVRSSNELAKLLRSAW